MKLESSRLVHLGNARNLSSVTGSKFPIKKKNKKQKTEDKIRGLTLRGPKAENSKWLA